MNPFIIAQSKYIDLRKISRVTHQSAMQIMKDLGYTDKLIHMAVCRYYEVETKLREFRLKA